ncbi:hypothetical protein TH61_06075 [Rufibacter sp. DG15C]|uniref:DUF2939 domain-containing protein n=1 Tax=Rufibacter sp. DG15C TaxID=1379909 RepID=UPI00078E487E|nr:DUF2939 domain-containing protein [Rufibacter sp. DG15C]AMM50833.1 hypothetical protein TH61_06075 [Rufibacter sp. DG15C]
MKKPLLWILVLVLLAAGGYWFYDRYVQGPEYSLYQIKKAVDARDMAAIEKYVDITRTSTSLLEQTTQAGLAEMSETDRAMAGLFIGMMMASQKDKVLQTLRAELERYVREGKAGQGPPANMSPQEWEQVQSLMPLEKVLRESQLENSQLEDIAYVNQQDSLAVVGLELRVPSKQNPLILEVQMLDKGDHWQIVGLPNAGAFLKELGVLGSLQQIKIPKLPKLRF